MTCSETELDSLLNALEDIGLTQTPREEMHRLLSEWEKSVNLDGIRRRSSDDILDLQKRLGTTPTGTFDLQTHDALARWSLPRFYIWMKDRKRDVRILTIKRREFLDPEHLVHHKGVAADFSRRVVLASTPQDLQAARLESWTLHDSLPPDLEFLPDPSVNEGGQIGPQKGPPPATLHLSLI